MKTIIPPETNSHPYLGSHILYDELCDLEYSIISCSKCPGLNVPKKTMSAPGYGNIKGEMFVVGQSLHSYMSITPSRQVPFIGQNPPDSGTLLYDLLDKSGYSFSKNNLYVTNVLKCHPENNRASTAKEINNCRSYLVQECSIFKSSNSNPKIILLLGKDAKNWFGIRGDSTVVRNTIHYIPSYHTSYLLRYMNVSTREFYVKALMHKIKNIKEKHYAK